MKSIYQHQSSMINMSFIIREYFQSHFTSPYHFHDSYELIYIAKSFGKLHTGNKIINFTDGDIFLLGPGFHHCFYNEKSFIASGEMAHAIVVFFNENFLGDDFFLKGELVKIKELLDNSKFGVKVKHPTAEMKKLFHRIANERGMEALIDLLILLNLLSSQKKNNLVFLNSSQDKPFLKDSSKLEPVFKYVIENFKDELNSKEAASLACLNEAAFCRYFKRRTEKTFSQFVNYVRITHATTLLLKTELSITNICFECGFNNISYFNRQFREIMGETPAKYRKALLEAKHDIMETTALDDSVLTLSETTS